MKITATITAANSRDRWAAAFPTVDCGRCFPILNGKMTAQPDECFRELAASPMVQGVDFRDKYLNQVVASWVRYVNGWKDENCIPKDAPENDRTLRRINRRLESGHSTHVRATWHQKRDHLTLAISLDNGGDVVEAREYERLFAWKMAEAAKVVNDDLAERGLATIRFDEATERLLAELAEWKREREAEKETKRLNEGRFLCPHHRNGFCVADTDGNPPDFKCRCHRNGRCVEAA